MFKRIAFSAVVLGGCLTAIAVGASSLVDAATATVDAAAPAVIEERNDARRTNVFSTVFVTCTYPDICTVAPVAPVTPVDPLDLDGDGLANDQEAVYGTNPNNPDTDGDDLTDGNEVNDVFTAPTVADTDGDGINDGQEVTNGTDPRDPTDR